MQALAQTFRHLRQLVWTAVPVPVWARLCRGMALRLGPSPAACCARVQARAASQAALSAGQRAGRAVYQLPWLSNQRQLRDSEDFGPWTMVRCGPVPDSSGRLLVSVHWDVLAVHELRPQPHLLFSLPNPEIEEGDTVRACWAPNSSAVALSWDL